MNVPAINKTEEFVFRICQRSFLSLWCYNNPKGKGGKELCDILVISEPHVIVVSVKDVSLNAGKNAATGHDRWNRKAVDASVRQIYGAERWLASASRVIRRDGSLGLSLPPLIDRKIHRLAVAFGGRGEVFISSGDFGKGFVHVMTEQSLQEVLTELDTITDLVDYLEAKEALIAGGCSVAITGSESNLVGWYLFSGRSFPSGQNLMMIDDTIWREILEKPEFKRRKEADRDSYTWDRLIEELSDPSAKPVGEFGPQLAESDIALRAMARETRFSRRILGRSVREFLEQAVAGKLHSRMLCSTSGVIYVFVFFSLGEDANFRIAELGNRCFIARHLVGCGDTVIAVGRGKHVPGVGSTSDLFYLYLDRWTAEDDEMAASMMAGTGNFARATTQRSHEDEYPARD